MTDKLDSASALLLTQYLDGDTAILPIKNAALQSKELTLLSTCSAEYLSDAQTHEQIDDVAILGYN